NTDLNKTENKTVAINLKNSSNNLPLISPLNIKDIKRISDEFGFRPVHPVLNKPSFHTGIDFSVNENKNVRSTGNGYIEKIVKSKNGYGNYIIINHENGYKTLYAHLNEIKVSEGEIVIEGTIIGKTGNTGLSTGPHLHYEVRLNNEPIDPKILYFKEPNKKITEDYMNELISLEKNLT
ncbi:MAG: M23 family metallopeptidase, partial [Bacillota bacterium]